MAKFQVLSSHGNGGGVFVEPGDVIELDEQEGRWRTAVGLVKPFVAAPAAPAALPETPEVPAAAEAVGGPGAGEAGDATDEAAGDADEASADDLPAGKQRKKPGKN